MPRPVRTPTPHAARTRVDDVAACVQVVESHQHLAHQAAHHWQRDATVVVQPAGRSGEKAGGEVRGGAAGDVPRRAGRWDVHSSAAAAAAAVAMLQCSSSDAAVQQAVRRCAPDEREQVVSQHLEDHAHVAAVRPAVLKPVDHAAAVVAVVCRGAGGGGGGVGRAGGSSAQGAPAGRLPPRQAAHARAPAAQQAGGLPALPARQGRTGTRAHAHATALPRHGCMAAA